MPTRDRCLVPKYRATYQTQFHPVHQKLPRARVNPRLPLASPSYIPNRFIAESRGWSSSSDLPSQWMQGLKRSLKSSSRTHHRQRLVSFSVHPGSLWYMVEVSRPNSIGVFSTCLACLSTHHPLRKALCSSASGFNLSIISRIEKWGVVQESSGLGDSSLNECQIFLNRS